MMAAALLFQHYTQLGDHAISRPASSDFYKFYLSAQRLHEGLSMYWLVPQKLKRGDPCHRDTPADQVHFEHPAPSSLNLGGDTPCLGPNLNPPIFIAFIQPLTRMPYRQAWWTWAAASCVATLWSAWLLSDAFSIRTDRHWQRRIWASLAFFAFYPSVANFTLGQVGTLLLPLLILSWRYGSQQKPGKSGLWLGTLIALKPFFIVLLPVLALVRQWRATSMAAATAVSLTALGWLLYGTQEQLNYMAVANNVTWLGTNWNGSWFGLFDRFFISLPASEWPRSLPLSRTIAAVCATATFAACAWAIRQLAHIKPALTWDAVTAIGLPMTLLITPLGWSYYLPCMLLCLMLAWKHIPSDSRHRNVLRMLIGLSICMAMVPITIKPSPTPLDPADWYGLDAWYWYTTMACLICTCACLAISAQSTRGAKAPLETS